MGLLWWPQYFVTFSLLMPQCGWYAHKQFVDESKVVGLRNSVQNCEATMKTALCWEKVAGPSEEFQASLGLSLAWYGAN